MEVVGVRPAIQKCCERIYFVAGAVAVSTTFLGIAFQLQDSPEIAQRLIRWGAGTATAAAVSILAGRYFGCVTSGCVTPEQSAV